MTDARGFSFHFNRIILWSEIGFIAQNKKIYKPFLTRASEKAMATHSSTFAWQIPWSLVGCSPWGRYYSDTTEQLHFHFSLSCIGEGNGNLLQYSCLENPRDGGAWWAAVCGVTQSRTRLKRLSSSSSSCQERRKAKGEAGGKG